MVEPINYIAALRRSWRLLVVLGLLFAIIAVLLPVSHPAPDKNDPVKWHTTSVVGAPPASGIVGTHTVSVAQILYFGNSFGVKAAALAAAKSPGPPLTLIGSMSATIQPSPGKSKKGTGLVLLNAFGATRADAAGLTNAYGTALQAQLDSIATANAAPVKGQSTTSSDASPSGFQVLAPASASYAVRTIKVSSNLGSSRKVRALAGLVVGLLLGAAIVLVVELLNRRLRSASRAEAHFKFPVVAEVPEAWPPGAGGGGPLIVVVADPASRAAESYRKLRMSVMFEALAPAGVLGSTHLDPYVDSLASVPIEPYSAPAPGSRAVILVVSPGVEESRPRVVANLGATYAEAGQRVIVVSTADLDSGVPAGTEISYVGAVGPDDVRSHLRQSSIADLSMLSLRPFVKNSAQLVGRAGLVLDAARQVADVILVEAPPLLEFHHGEALAHAVDVVLVVGEYGVTTFADADQTGVLLRRIGAPVLGVVFTETPLNKAEMRTQRVPALQPEPVGDSSEADLPEAMSQYPVETQA